MGDPDAAPGRGGLEERARELLATAGTRVDVRTVAGRLGHGGGGTTTLRVYAAWVSEADQRASTGLLGPPTGAPDGSAGLDRPDRARGAQSL